MEIPSQAQVGVRTTPSVCGMRHTGRHTSEPSSGQYVYWSSAVVFSPDGTTLASGSFGQATIRLWNANTGNHLRTLIRTYGWGLEAYAFSPDGTTLASGSEDGHHPYMER